MYLKSLELFGFKSFAPKTVLNFHRGVTCVVGPNGCGKSNVLDAIRWVLGEQSAKALRGGEMADVIFSGTDSRQALGMAEVSMCFAECEQELGLDWNEVTITRRVFRDGGSEYFLNKTPCRLRDIHQLFMDTGIGRSAYSIMEQGKIDAILSSKPEDRRAIFEEAAGITKYKAQKKEALRKLEATEANLLRLDDIIKEVKRQIGSLQRQAGKARRYQALLADLKILETHQAHRQWGTLQQQLEDTGAELSGLRARQAESESEIERQEGEVATQRSALAELEGQLETARRGVGDARTRISNHESRIIFNQERAAEFAGLVERYQSDLSEATERQQAAEAQLHETDQQLEQITATLAEELRVLEQRQAAVAASADERAQAERTLSNLAQELQRAEQKLSGIRGRSSGLVQQRDGAEMRISMLDAELETLAGALARVEEARTQTAAEVERLQAQLEQATAQLAASEAEQKRLQGALGQIEGELRTAERQLSDKESRLDVLRGLIENGEGFSQGTQAVLKGLNNPDFFKPAILGALAQYIRVAPEWLPAVEAVLGANLETIVMKDTMIAEAVMNTLTAEKMGKASLALRELDRVFEHVESQELKLPEGAIDWLIRKVDAAPEVQRVVERLINHTVLVPDLATALRLFPQRGSAVVTLQGEVLTGNGILHGGQQAQGGQSLLERKNQAAALEGEVAAARTAVEEIQARRDGLVTELENAVLALDEAREQKQQATLSLSTLRNQLGLHDREKADVEKKAESLRWERGSAEARLQEAAGTLAGLEEEAASAEGELESLRVRQSEAEGQRELLRVREAELGGELNELKIRVATERQRHTSLHGQRQPMENRIAELQELIFSREQDIQTYEQRHAATLTETEEIQANLVGLRERLEIAELEVAGLVDTRATLVATAEELAGELRILRTQIAASHEQRSRLEVKYSQYEMRLNSVVDRMQKRYNLDLSTFERDLHGLRVALREAQKRQSRGGSASSSESEEAPSASAEADETPTYEASETEAFELDWNAVDMHVAELDSRVESMGPVNLDAIQEYDELEERYSFLEKQNSDLQNSKTELLEVLQKINKTTRELFAETFEKIRVNFQEMFSELFGTGGKANLVLTDETDVLESGIDIIAKPPGKQLQAISLLSGGERTMTAVALLFAIYMVKPSPFCVLDEMDAPLDESNISRFIKILDRFVGQSQFVVISHHKRTIARADALYGVTMEEHGVSKLVGVRFAKRDEDATKVESNGFDAEPPSVAETFGKKGTLASENEPAAGKAKRVKEVLPETEEPEAPAEAAAAETAVPEAAAEAEPQASAEAEVTSEAEAPVEEPAEVR